MKKILALATTVTLLLTFSIPVLADDTKSNTSMNQAPTSQSSPKDRAAKAKEHLQNEITKLQTKQQFQQYMGPVRDLQKQEVQIREQIRSLRTQIKQQVKTDRQAKNYTALTTALNDMITMQDDITAVANAAQTCLTDWQQYYTDRQAKNIDGITADLQKLAEDIQNIKIPALQKLLADLQKVSAELNSPAATTPTPAPAPSQSTSDSSSDSSSSTDNTTT